MDDMLSMLLNMEGTPPEREESKVLRAPFGWPGGKSRSIEQILKHLPYLKCYNEPFGGSGAVLLSRNRSKIEIFNDRYSGVVAFYRVFRSIEDTKRLAERLDKAVYSREEFCWCKETWDSSELDDIERAARWLYMIQASFSRLGRNFGRGTAVISAATTSIFPDRVQFMHLHERLKTVQFENRDWWQCCLDFDSPETVHYLDPPYIKTAPGTYKHSFSYTDHVDLLNKIQSLKGFVALSGYSSDLYDKDHTWDDIHSWRSVVTMNAKVGNAGNNRTYDASDYENHAETEKLYIRKAKT